MLENTSTTQLMIEITATTKNRDNSLSSASSLIYMTPVEKKRTRRKSNSDHISSSSSSTTSSEVQQYKLTREDSQRPIASEKIKRRSDHHDKNASIIS